ncbi:MAG: GT4 family glycosyltransferase PelF [Streptosporangiaceae bacterium]
MEVALIGEGTYPHQFGGVSVWTDQLIRGMPGYRFQAVALVATGSEPVRWELPENVTSVITMPLWGPEPARRTTRGQAQSVLRPLGELVDVLLSPPAEAQDRFEHALRELFEFAQQHSLSAGLGCEGAVRLLSEAWRERSCEPGTPTPTLHDAVTALQLLDHALRPLSHPPVQADLAHAVTNGLGVLPALAAKWQHGTPMLLTEHGMYMREQYMHAGRVPQRWPVKALHLAFLRRLCTVGYQRSELIAPGNAYNKRWEQRLGADPARIRTVYNGVHPTDFPTVVGEPEVPTISWAGRIDPVKDLDTLLQAFAQINREMPGARLRMFGSAPPGQEDYLEGCKKLAAELGISELASFEGRVDNIRDAYAAGHVVVLCSITEGFPYTLIEAMTCGRVCVATDVGGVTEALADTGLVVPPRSPQPLAEACLSLLQDDYRRRSMGTAARQRALEFFTVARSISSYEEIYESLGSGCLPEHPPAERPPAERDEPADPVPLGAAG